MLLDGLGFQKMEGVFRRYSGQEYETLGDDFECNRLRGVWKLCERDVNSDSFHCLFLLATLLVCASTTFVLYYTSKMT
jgi:hypothetical protein